MQCISSVSHTLSILALNGAVRWWFFSTDEHTHNVLFASGCAYCANICHIMISFLLLLLLLFVKLFRFLRHGFVIMCSFASPWHSGVVKMHTFLWFSFWIFTSSLWIVFTIYNYFFDSIECVCTRLFF